MNKEVEEKTAESVEVLEVVETFEEKKARIFARNRANQTGTRLEKKKTKADIININNAYGKHVDHYYDTMSLSEMEEFDVESISNKTERSAFIDVFIQKRMEDIQAKAELKEGEFEPKEDTSEVETLGSPDEQSAE